MSEAAKRPAILALADGTIFRGNAFGAEKSVTEPAVGEVVFNTSMMGYQEIITDPSYAGQMMTFTCPHIGNVGCNAEDVESAKVHTTGVIIRNETKRVSNFRAELSFDKYLQKNGVMGLSGIDTRRLVTHVREEGAQMGAMASGRDANPDDLIDQARAQGSMEGKDYVRKVTCQETYSWSELPWTLGSGYKKLEPNKLWSRPHCVAIDCGVKANILRLLLAQGFRVTVVPATSAAADIEALQPDALFLSNGPGDPATVHYVVDIAKHFLGRLPVFGICLGHQILAQAAGGKTFKLKFGHRGGNHPVIDYNTEKVEITVQNHGFAVAEDSLPNDVRVSHLNLNDRTVEGLELPERKAFSIQYHPEASPGPHDAQYLFRRFFEMVVGYRDKPSRSAKKTEGNGE